VSPRVAPHHHPCADCGIKTECPGTWEENYDGSPEVICPEFHLGGGEINADFICEACEWKREDAAKAEKAETPA
jgi:hypothetical protein